MAPSWPSKSKLRNAPQAQNSSLLAPLRFQHLFSAASRCPVKPEVRGHRAAHLHRRAPPCLLPAVPCSLLGPADFQASPTPTSQLCPVSRSPPAPPRCLSQGLGNSRAGVLERCLRAEGAWGAGNFREGIGLRYDESEKENYNLSLILKHTDLV